MSGELLSHLRHLFKTTLSSLKRKRTKSPFQVTPLCKQGPQDLLPSSFFNYTSHFLCLELLTFASPPSPFFLLSAAASLQCTIGSLLCICISFGYIYFFHLCILWKTDPSTTLNVREHLAAQWALQLGAKAHTLSQDCCAFSYNTLHVPQVGRFCRPQKRAKEIVCKLPSSQLSDGELPAVKKVF